MVDLLHRPLRQIIIMEYVQFENPEELVKNLILPPGQPAVLFWAGGVIFVPLPVPLVSDIAVKEALEGRIYWSNVFFSAMPEYNPRIHSTRIPEVTVIDVSASATFNEVAKWLRERLK